MRIKRLKCFVLSWNQSRESSASLMLLCVKNCRSLILLDCCDSTLPPLCPCSSLHIYTQTNELPVNRPVCTRTDLRVKKQSHRCFPVTCMHHPSQWGITTCTFLLPTHPHGFNQDSPGFQPPQSPFSLFYQSQASTSRFTWIFIVPIRRHGENLMVYFGVFWGLWCLV